MASFSTLVYWVIFVAAIFFIVAVSFITGIVACFRPCCVTRTIKDPEGDNLISSGMQTEEVIEEDETPQEEPEDVIFVTKHSNNKFSVDRRKSTVATVQSVAKRQSMTRPNNGSFSPPDLAASSNRIYPSIPGSPVQSSPALNGAGIIIPQPTPKSPPPQTEKY